MIILETYKRIITMNYYEMIVPWEPEILGVKDGLEQARVVKDGFKNENNYNTFIENFVNQSFVNLDKLSTINFELENVKLRKGAKLTDFLSFSPKSFCLISPKISTVFANKYLAPHKLFPAIIEVSEGKKIEGYSFFYLPSSDVNHIVFHECQFEVGNKHDGFKELRMSSSADLFSIDDFLIVKKISLSGVSSDLDLLKVKLPVGILISSPLYEELTAADVTGIKFRQIEVELIEK